jgi:hypothetical protein
LAGAWVYGHWAGGGGGGGTTRTGVTPHLVQVRVCDHLLDNIRLQPRHILQHGRGGLLGLPLSAQSLLNGFCFGSICGSVFEAEALALLCTGQPQPTDPGPSQSTKGRQPHSRVLTGP